MAHVPVERMERRKKEFPISSLSLITTLLILQVFLLPIPVFSTVTGASTSKTKSSTGIEENNSNHWYKRQIITQNPHLELPFSEHQYRFEKVKQRNLGHHHKRNYYQFLDDDVQSHTTSLADVWLCIVCALGWTIYLVSTRQPPQLQVFEQRDSSKAMGHVLQVSLGEDVLGTGIPVYYVLVDYVVEADSDEDHIQVRKVFATKKLLEEGFANVEVLYLTDDPTTAILLEDFLLEKKERERESQEPPSPAYFALIYSVAAILIGTSIFGAILAIHRLDDDSELFGWISLAVGVVFMYPCARLLYWSFTYVYNLASISERPGVILHGKRLYWTKQCHGVNPFELFNKDDDEQNSVELSEFQKKHTTKDRNRSKPTPQKYPNAGCGFGNFNVHLPTGRPRTSSSVSSISASASASQNSTDKNHTANKIVRNDTSILEKYEMHVSARNKTEKK